jgi:hypothetical protein
MLIELTADVRRRNWLPSDLVEITRRSLSSRHVDLVTRLTAQAEPGEVVDIDAPAGVQVALDLAMLLRLLPPIADVTRTIGDTVGGPGSDAPPESSAVLAKVRSLLAKAESTEFPAEAEALSAKAQELIATYALDRYVAQLDDSQPREEMTVRRLWIDAPYVNAKAMLVDAVASANHCRSVLSAGLGFVTLVGQGADVEATELLVTSLLVQADRAMLRQGRLDHEPGRSRTRSFRQSFLVSYASRIGERLRQTSAQTVAGSDRSTELVPVMARHDELVQAATAELFPAITTRRTRASDHAGWMAGRAAADLARFDIRDGLTDQAAS